MGLGTNFGLDLLFEMGVKLVNPDYSPYRKLTWLRNGMLLSGRSVKERPSCVMKPGTAHELWAVPTQPAMWDVPVPARMPQFQFKK